MALAKPKQNRGGNGRTGVHDLSPKVRAAFVRALARLAKDPSDAKTETQLATLIEKSLEKDFIATMTMIAKFNPRESTIKADVVGLADVLKELNERSSERPVRGSDSPVESPAADLRH